jgi:tetratricopeptide (TPR) repeat protein
MSIRLQRARLLMMQHRPEQALEHLQQAIGEDPSNPFVHLMMANCQLELEDTKAAVAAAEQALQLAPALDSVHYTLSRAYLEQGKKKRALECIDEAIGLDPEDSENHSMRGYVLYRMGRYEDALESIETGLMLDPENVEANTLRAHALIKLNRVPDAHNTLGVTLGRDPENPQTHTAMGWTNLHAGNPDAALPHFQEALRLNPNHEGAREGMVETLKSQYRVYALFLGFMLWLHRLSATYRWGVIVGIWVAQEILVRVENFFPALAPVATPLLWLLILFCVSTWFFNPFFNGLLLFHREGRMALSRHEATEGGIVMGVVALSLALIVFRLFTGLSHVTFVSLGVLGVALLVRGLYEYRVPWQRLVWLATATALIAMITADVLLLLGGYIIGDLAGVYASVIIMTYYWRGLIAAIVMTWFFGRQ